MKQKEEERDVGIILEQWMLFRTNICAAHLPCNDSKGQYCHRHFQKARTAVLTPKSTCCAACRRSCVPCSEQRLWRSAHDFVWRQTLPALLAQLRFAAWGEGEVQPTRALPDCCTAQRAAPSRIGQLQFYRSPLYASQKGQNSRHHLCCASSATPTGSHLLQSNG